MKAEGQSEIGVKFSWKRKKNLGAGNMNERKQEEQLSILHLILIFSRCSTIIWFYGPSVHRKTNKKSLHSNIMCTSVQGTASYCSSFYTAMYYLSLEMFPSRISSSLSGLQYQSTEEFHAHLYCSPGNAIFIIASVHSHTLRTTNLHPASKCFS